MANGKTLVFSFDGTGNEPSDAGEFKQNESVSNVIRYPIHGICLQCHRERIAL